MCGKYTDAEYKKERCSDPERYYNLWGRWGITKIWRDDILPCRVYLRHCVLAASKYGEEVKNNFLNSSFLGDRVTTIGQYLLQNPTIMTEMVQLPPEIKGRYLI
eukprot:TRINITY_DN16297_c0_g1_i1.p1 TRINITY_DN16297_c0_g1~~TRINITY_DN16297_c0_g1_i1.p1  ORF type:complete len:111 (+),score=13.27 TRINITY_DN16297_c0_g1_i1:23-334(+)